MAITVSRRVIPMCPNCKRIYGWFYNAMNQGQLMFHYFVPHLDDDGEMGHYYLWSGHGLWFCRIPASELPEPIRALASGQQVY